MSELSYFSLLSGKSIPVHCVVEVLVPEDGPHPRRSRAVVETDSYAIIPVATPFEELVHVALYRLGYPQDCAHLATGTCNFFAYI
jgi:Ubiquitin-like oligomerisation domain of SATB